ncbi:CLUMA_CG012939, isoform A [Clunio marinus]|uniref:BLOC-1-related complex subunit 7 n=1 Tax=Clunio marinus TaxID=568069 RepID=A0A1J1IHC8_9DIPT|nr:CLUMA_CG012939, isoform A [Clunio marinus]
MSSACPQAAKSLFAESKRRLSDRVAVNVNNCASVARQIVRGSKSHDILMQAAKGLAQQESSLERSASNLNKIQLIQQQLRYQHEAVKDGAEKLSDLREQVDSMQR